MAGERQRKEASLSHQKTIRQAARDQVLVTVYRDGLTDVWLTGYVAQCGPEWFALDVVDQGIRYDGVSCLRYADVTDCEAPATNAEFAEKALAALGEKRPHHLELDLASLESLLQSAGSLFPVVSLSLEVADLDAVWIGRVESVSRHLAVLRLINPDASWDPEPEEFSLEEITRVDFGSTYERALVLVGGKGGIRYN
jgi:hypothetical protein